MDPTAESDAPKRHTNNDIWSRIHDQGKQIADLQTGLGKLEARVEGGFQGLSSQMQSVLSAVDRLSMPKPPTDIKGWLALALTILGTLGLIGLLVVKPMQERQDRIEERQWEEMRKLSFEQGYQRALRELD